MDRETTEMDRVRDRLPWLMEIPMGLFHLNRGDRWGCMFVSDKCMEILECSMADFLERLMEIQVVSLQDLPEKNVGMLLEKMKRTREGCLFVGVWHSPTGGKKQVRGSLCVSMSADGRLRVYGQITDVTMVQMDKGDETQKQESDRVKNYAEPENQTREGITQEEGIQEEGHRLNQEQEQNSLWSKESEADSGTVAAEEEKGNRQRQKQDIRMKEAKYGEENQEKTWLKEFFQAVASRYPKIVLLNLTKNEYQILCGISGISGTEGRKNAGRIEAFWETQLKQIHPQEKKKVKKCLSREALIRQYMKGKKGAAERFYLKKGKTPRQLQIKLYFYRNEQGQACAFLLLREKKKKIQ